jgi:CDP-2,3-bis-(O-geranylgeranyl)-sn-glycerol synthase
MELDPLRCAAFLVVAFALAGCAQAVWLGTPASRRLAIPVDGGWTFRERRLFGDNKTVRGFVVMLPATGLTFFLLSRITAGAVPGLWPLTGLEYAGLGVLAGAGFMTGELPNSFLKRRLGIAPGSPAAGPVTRPLFFLADRLDSTAGVLAALTLAVPVPLATAAYVLIAGSVVHSGFSVLTFRLGGKARAA